MMIYNYHNSHWERRGFIAAIFLKMEMLKTCKMIDQSEFITIFFEAKNRIPKRP